MAQRQRLDGTDRAFEGCPVEVRVRVELDTGGYARGEPVVVCIQKKLSSTTGMFGFILDDRVVFSKAQMLIEDDSATPLAELFTEALTEMRALLQLVLPPEDPSSTTAIPVRVL